VQKSFPTNDSLREATSEYPVTANFNHIGADGITVPDWPTLDLSVWLESRSKNESTVEGLDIPRFCFRASTARVDSVGPQYRDDYDPVLTSARLVRLESTPTELVFDKFLVWRNDHISARRFTVTDTAQLRVRENIATVGEHRAYDELDLGQLEDLESRLTTLVSFLGATTLTEA